MHFKFLQFSISVFSKLQFLIFVQFKYSNKSVPKGQKRRRITSDYNLLFGFSTHLWRWYKRKGWMIRNRNRNCVC